MRKTEIVSVPTWPDNRDSALGRKYLITEMPSAQSEKWAWRLFIAVKGTTAQVPPEIERFGMVGVAIQGINSFLAADVDFAKIEPLLDEMMTCVQIIRDPKAMDKLTGEPVATPLVSPDDIEEVQTRMWLRSEVIRVHTGFSSAAALSTLFSMIRAPAEQTS